VKTSLGKVVEQTVSYEITKKHGMKTVSFYLKYWLKFTYSVVASACMLITMAHTTAEWWHVWNIGHVVLFIEGSLWGVLSPRALTYAHAAIKPHCGETAWQLPLIFFIAISASTFCLYMRYALPVVGYVWLGNPKTGKGTFDNNYWPTLAVTCGHLYLLFNACTGSTGNRLRL